MVKVIVAYAILLLMSASIVAGLWFAWFLYNAYSG